MSSQIYSNEMIDEKICFSWKSMNRMDYSGKENNAKSGSRPVIIFYTYNIGFTFFVTFFSSFNMGKK